MIGFKGFAISSMGNERPVIWDHHNADHRRAFATALAPMVSVLWKRKEPFGKLEAAVYMRTLKYVTAAILVKAVERALETETWFPEPAKLLDHAAEIQAELRRIASAPLEQCEHSSHFVENAEGKLARCPCWVATMAEMAEVGEPLKRKELPPANPHVEMV